jgi:hypothetical protein
MISIEHLRREEQSIRPNAASIFHGGEHYWNQIANESMASRHKGGIVRNFFDYWSGFIVAYGTDPARFNFKLASDTRMVLLVIELPFINHSAVCP